MKNKSPKNYIFDMDGTIIDSMPVFGETMIAVLKENNIDYPDDILKIVTPLGYEGTAEYYINLGLNLAKSEILKIFSKKMLDKYAFDIPLKSNVQKTLSILKQKGDSVNLLTASPHTMIDPCLKRLNIFDLFDNVWSVDDFEYRKSDYRIYQCAAKKLNSSEENCVFIDDNLNAIKAAKSAKMTTVGIYDKSSESFTETMKKEADFYIDDMSELLNI